MTSRKFKFQLLIDFWIMIHRLSCVKVYSYPSKPFSAAKFDYLKKDPKFAIRWMASVDNALMMKDLSVLQESPFTDRGSVVELFADLTVWMGIRRVIEQINANAMAA